MRDRNPNNSFFISPPTNPAPSSHIPTGQNFLFLLFQIKIQKTGNAMRLDIHWTVGHWYCFIKDSIMDK